MFYLFDENRDCHVLLADDPEQDGYSGDYKGNAEFIGLDSEDAHARAEPAETTAATFGLQKGHKIRLRVFPSIEACRGENYEPIGHRWVGKSWKEYCATGSVTNGQPVS